MAALPSLLGAAAALVCISAAWGVRARARQRGEGVRRVHHGLVLALVCAAVLCATLALVAQTAQ